MPSESNRDKEADNRKWFVLIAASLGTFLGTVMATSVNVALPSLVSVLGTKFAVVQWVVLSFLLTNAVLLPIVGRLADMLGKKSLFIAGYVIFTLGSLLCGLSQGVYWLIGFRVLQGAGAALLTALSLAIVTDVFPDNERGKALGITGSVLSSGIVIGPTLGGFLVDTLSWHWVFFIGVPIGILGTLLALRFVPAYEPKGGQHFDLPGAAVLFSCLLALLLALTLGQQRGFGGALILGLFAVSALLLAIFVWLELRVEDPVIDLRLFKNADLSIGLVTGFATFVAIAGTIFLMPFYLENILGYAPRNVGLLMAIVPVVLVFIAPVAGSLSDRFGARPITVIGLVLVLAGYLAIGTLDADTTALSYVLLFLPVGLGMGVFQSPNNSAIMGSVPREKSGVAGGLLSETRALGQTSGIAILGTLWAARVAARAPSQVGGDATNAPVEAQIGGLHDMFTFIQVMIALALVLCVWDLFRRRQRADKSERVDEASDKGTSGAEVATAKR